MLELAFAAMLLCLTLAVWSALIARHRAGASWVPYAPREVVPWALLDVCLALGLLLVLTTVALTMAGGGPAESGVAAPESTEAALTTRSVLAQAVASIGVLLISILAIRVRYGATAADLGWSAARIMSDVRLGAIAFLALGPPVYLLQMVLVHWLQFPSKHPIIELIRQRPAPDLIAVCALSAVVVAPVVEEYLFRGLLQGWLERVADGQDGTPQVVLGGPSPPLWARRVTGDMRPARWPVAVSAAAFAMLHIQHGPDWVPLFVLALGLGYLYRQTHRLLPAVTVHFLLNLCSLLMIPMST